MEGLVPGPAPTESIKIMDLRSVRDCLSAWSGCRKSLADGNLWGFCRKLTRRGTKSAIFTVQFALQAVGRLWETDNLLSGESVESTFRGSE